MHTIGPLVRFSHLFSFVELGIWELGMGVGGYLGRGLVMMELASRHAGVNRLRFPFFSLLVFGHLIPFP